MTRMLPRFPKKYFYLWAGCPELSADAGFLPFSLPEWQETLSQHLSPNDYAHVASLFLPNDHQNLLNFLLAVPQAPWLSPSVFSSEDIQECQYQTQHLRPYLAAFVQLFQESKSEKANWEWENILLDYFYTYARHYPQPLVRQWFGFEQDIKNIRAAENCRQFGQSLAEHLIGQNELNELLLARPLADTDFARRWAYGPEILHALHLDSLLAREQAFDRLRWQWLEDHTTFAYFQVENIFAFTAKLQIVARWSILKSPEAAHFWKELLGNLQKTLEKGF
ncbi:MAG: DUF2764 family protein [Microscillaceae bacterium]|nr:DUF2764 family protein [Microscillaceae bacterium]